VLADDYLASTGGWVPDDILDPTGPGVPASGVTTGEAIQLIDDEQLTRIYSITGSGVVSFGTNFQINLDPGLSDNDVLAAIEAKLEDFVENQFEDTELSFVNLDSFTGTVINGPTTASERQAIQNSIASGGKITNPKTIALVAARARWSLDNTFNVKYLYTVPTKDFFVRIVQYTNSSTYNTESATATNQYAIKLDRTTYQVTSGLVTPL
jgi:hypothetical protein